MRRLFNRSLSTALIWGMLSVGAFGQNLSGGGIISTDLSSGGEIGTGSLSDELGAILSSDGGSSGNSDAGLPQLTSPQGGWTTAGETIVSENGDPVPSDSKQLVSSPNQTLNQTLNQTPSQTSNRATAADDYYPVTGGGGGYYDPSVGYDGGYNNGYGGDNGGYFDANGNYQYYDPYAAYGSPATGGLFDGYRTPGRRLFVDGWVATGADSSSNWPITTAAGGANNDSASSFQMNQLYLSLGIDTVKSNAISFGGRVDLLYGADYLYTSSLGLEVGTKNAAGFPVDSVYAAEPKWNRNSKGGHSQYGLAMPQAYAEVFLPSMDGLTVKMGHFYSPLGYESVMSTSNFFYTHSYSMLYGEPQTVTGLLATQKINANWSFLGGFTQGWNVWEDPNDKMSFIAGAKWENFCKTSSLSFTLMSGDELSDVEDSKITNYSLVYQQQLNPCLQFVLQHDMGFADNGGYGYDATGNIERTDAKWASLVNYVYWQLSDVSTLGFRFEWFQDGDLSRVLALPVYSNMPIAKNQWKGQNFYDISLGLNWKPNSWLTVRPEVRYDWSDLENVDGDGNVVTTGVYDDFTKKELFTVGGDVVVRF